jgi:hypothetical protein
MIRPAPDPAGGGQRVVRGFGEWLGEPSIAWWGTLVRRRYPDRMLPLSQFDGEADALLLDDLFDALDGYLASLEV